MRSKRKNSSQRERIRRPGLYPRRAPARGAVRRRYIRGVQRSRDLKTHPIRKTMWSRRFWKSHRPMSLWQSRSPGRMTVVAEPEPESDASASHHIDPAASHRLPALWLRQEEEGRGSRRPNRQALQCRSVSSYAPGTGLIEEEVIEEEEFDAPRIHRRPKPKNTTWTILKRRRCPPRCAPATWAKCSRRPTSTTASS